MVFILGISSHCGATFLRVFPFQHRDPQCRPWIGAALMSSMALGMGLILIVAGAELSG